MTSTRNMFINIARNNIKRKYHNVPFFDFYERTTGQTIDVTLVKKKHPNIDKITQNSLTSTLQILKKFGISDLNACLNPHILIMNPITMDNYGEILKECGFIELTPKYIIRYHTLVRSRTISGLKNNGLIEKHEDIQERILKMFSVWPSTHKIHSKVSEATTSLLNLRMKILQLYLNWRLGVTAEEFEKYCRLYLPLRHRPMSDIQAAIDIALSEIKIEPNIIRRNGFIIAADPVNTRLVLENVPSLADLDIRDVVRIEPAVMKNNYNSLKEIRSILQEYGISQEAQRKYLKVYCLSPKTVRSRLEDLAQLKEFQVLASNPRVLTLVVHKNKMLSRLHNINTVSKHTYSLNNLVSSAKVFNNYINNFGDKTCCRDITTLICSFLNVNGTKLDENLSNSTKKCRDKLASYITIQLKKHKYCLHIPLKVVYENIKLLQTYFPDDVILTNCQLLLYPMSDIKINLEAILQMRNSCHLSETKVHLDSGYSNLDYSLVKDEHVLSLILYELEKRHHFSGDGIWSKNEQHKMSGRAS